MQRITLFLSCIFGTFCRAYIGLNQVGAVFLALVFSSLLKLHVGGSLSRQPCRILIEPSLIQEKGHNSPAILNRLQNRSLSHVLPSLQNMLLFSTFPVKLGPLRAEAKTALEVLEDLEGSPLENPLKWPFFVRIF